MNSTQAQGKGSEVGHLAICYWGRLHSPFWGHHTTKQKQYTIHFFPLIYASIPTFQKSFPWLLPCWRNVYAVRPSNQWFCRSYEMFYYISNSTRMDYTKDSCYIHRKHFYPFFLHFYPGFLHALRIHIIKYSSEATANWWYYCNWNIWVAWLARLPSDQHQRCFGTREKYTFVTEKGATLIDGT